MPRRFAAASAVALAAVLLTACTSAPTPDPEPPTPAPTGSIVTGGGSFPGCDEILAAMPEVLSGLAYDETVSAGQTADEAYEQRVCVYTTADAATQVGVTLAAIPFLDTELDAYGASPTAIADDRLAEHHAVLQTLKPGDVDDGHLDSALYLFDKDYSITIQGLSKDGSVTTASLPQLTIIAATDAAFAVRDLIA
jgi:hypothetical protein